MKLDVLLFLAMVANHASPASARTLTMSSSLCDSSNSVATNGGSVVDTFSVGESCLIEDVNLVLDYSTDFFSESAVFLVAPAGTFLGIYSDLCAGVEAITIDGEITFDDQATLTLGQDSDDCPQEPGTTTLLTDVSYQPETLNTLAGFDGSSATGTWILDISDNNGNTGPITLRCWSLVLECALEDDDNDGVDNAFDQCPGTAAGAAVEADGCPDAMANSDPHFQTWSGRQFEYQGVCDLVLLQNALFANGLGLYIHARTAGYDFFSAIETVAMKIGNHVLEINNKANLYINGVEQQHEKETELSFAGFPLVHKTIKNGSTHWFQVTLDDGAAIDIHVWSIYVGVFVKRGSSSVFKHSLGMMGDYETGRMLGRDGATELASSEMFASEWQVNNVEDGPSLFQMVRAPVFPAMCTIPEHVGRRLVNKELEAAADVACAHWGKKKADCIYDVLATGDINLAYNEIYSLGDGVVF